MLKKTENYPANQKRIEKQKELLIEQLRKTPIIEIACQKAGVGRTSFYRWRAEDAKFDLACNESFGEGVELINDLAESKLVSQIQNDNTNAIRFWLQNHHKLYANKVQITTPVKQELTDKEKQQLVDAYQKLGLISTNMEPYDKQQLAGPADAGSGDEQQDGEN